MRPPTQPKTLMLPAVLATAVFTAAGGYIHAREWVNVYRDVPSLIPGSAVVRVGFPINVVASIVLTAALLVAAVWVRRLIIPALAVTAVFQVGSLAALIISRTGTLLGWMEPGWTAGANQTRAAEVGALVSATLAVAVVIMVRRAERPTPVGYAIP